MSMRLSGLTLRSFAAGDEAAILNVVGQAFRGIEYLPRVKKGLSLSSPYFHPNGCFLAEEDNQVKGCIAVLGLPRKNWFEIRYLAATPGPDQVTTAQKLVSRALEYAEENQAERVKAFVPSVQPFVDVYKNAEFEPARRQLRISWDLTEPYEPGKSFIETRRIPESSADEATSVWVNGLRPYWDWWIEEHGGPTTAGAWIKDSLKRGEIWIGAYIGEKLVGSTLLRPDFYDTGESRFSGVYVLPDYRDRGIGSALMNAAIRRAQELGQKRMRVYTFAYLDCLPPAPVLYLKSGGKIEAEYLQLERRVPGNRRATSCPPIDMAHPKEDWAERDCSMRLELPELSVEGYAKRYEK